MEDAPKRQQKTERLQPPIETGFGKVYLERRNGSPLLTARTFIQGAYKTWNTGERYEKDARKTAAKQFLDFYLKSQTEHLHGHLFSEVADRFLEWVDSTKKGEISDGQRTQYRIKWKVLEPYFADLKIKDVDHKFLVSLRDRRSKEKTQFGSDVKASTLQKDLTFVRLVLRYALEVEKCIDRLPQFPRFRGEFAVEPSPTPYLTLKEYLRLFDEAKAQTKKKGLNPRTKRQREELYCFVLICVCAALRVGEAHSIRWMDCERTTLKNGEPAIKMFVFGKHSKRTGKREEAYGLYHAVGAYEYLKKRRPDAKPTDKLFIEKHRDGVSRLLELAKLRDTKDGQKRTAKSFRHTGISLWLRFSQNASVEDIAIWARTSPEMVRSWYNQNPVLDSVERIAAFRKPVSTDS